MAGHSKWAKVKHFKGAVDAKRGKIFSKLSKEISIAARLAGADPGMNPRLRMVLLKCRAANMPNDNIERAIKKGTGGGETANFEDLTFEIYGPRGVAVGSDGKVWVADTGNQRVVVCPKDLSSPKFVGGEGAPGNPFVSPVGIAAGPSGRIYVADAGNRRIEVLDSDGNPKTNYPVQGWGPNTEPYLEVDEDENIYASDPSSKSVVKFDRNGKEAKRFTEDDAGRGFQKPTGVAIDRKNRILYVVNTDNDTIGTLKLSK